MVAALFTSRTFGCLKPFRRWRVSRPAWLGAGSPLSYELLHRTRSEAGFFYHRLWAETTLLTPPPWPTPRAVEVLDLPFSTKPTVPYIRPNYRDLAELPFWRILFWLPSHLLLLLSLLLKSTRLSADWLFIWKKNSSIQLRVPKLRCISRFVVCHR
jgi:hypothetical protein